MSNYRLENGNVMANETVEIGPQIQQYIVEHFPLARKQSIIADSSLLECGIIDSLGVLDLINFLLTYKYISKNLICF